MSGDPFRSDARVERRAECAPPAEAWTVMARAAPLRTWTVAYLLVLMAGTALLALTVPAAKTPGLVTTGALALLTMLIVQVFLRQRRTAEAAPAQRCWFTREAVVLASDTGESAWRYEGVRGLERVGPWLLVVFEGEFVAVLRAEGAEGDALVSFLMERTTQRAPSEHRARVLRLVALGVTWVSIVAAAIHGR